MSVINHDRVGHRFTTEVDGSRAELDYTLADRVMTITHTLVPPAIGGRGIAAELMEAALSAARGAGWSVNPACSYAKSYLEKHPQGSTHAQASTHPQGSTHAQASDKQHVDELLDEALDESFPASDSPSVGGSS
jgi:predicted GNAT family acetyltransferase